MTTLQLILLVLGVLNAAFWADDPAHNGSSGACALFCFSVFCLAAVAS